MPRPATRSLAALAIASTLLLAACESATPATAAPGSTAEPVASASPAPTLTPVPGGATSEPVPVPTPIQTVQTEWGEILVTLPDGFPVYPGAGPVDLPEIASASLSADADAEAVAGWYADTLAERGYQVDASEPLEDGGRSLDVLADIPECRIRIDFRPAEDSTIITVLYGAGCAGAGG